MAISYRLFSPINRTDATNQDYFMKTFNEINETHSLSLFEELNARENMLTLYESSDV